MFSVFSNTNKKMSEQIRELQKCAGSMYDRTLFAGPKDEPLYILKPEVIDILTWVNKNILFKLSEVKTSKDAQWVGVRMRIATNMLNKVENILTKDVCMMYHERMVSNIRKILGDIYTEDLPF